MTNPYESPSTDAKAQPSRRGHGLTRLGLGPLGGALRGVIAAAAAGVAGGVPSGFFEGLREPGLHAETFLFVHVDWHSPVGLAAFHGLLGAFLMLPVGIVLGALAGCRLPRRSACSRYGHSLGCLLLFMVLCAVVGALNGETTICNAPPLMIEILLGPVLGGILTAVAGAALWRLLWPPPAAD
jgi:hypothetical protein